MIGMIILLAAALVYILLISLELIFIYKKSKINIWDGLMPFTLYLGWGAGIYIRDLNIFWLISYFNTEIVNLYIIPIVVIPIVILLIYFLKILITIAKPTLYARKVSLIIFIVGIFLGFILGFGLPAMGK